MNCRSRRYCIERLEQRTLLAGVTIITHGFQLSQSYPGWVETMADEVARRLAPNAPDPWTEITRYHMTISGWPQPQVQIARTGPAPTTSSTGEAVVTIDWAVLAGLFPLASNIPVADLAAQTLLTDPLTDFGSGRHLLNLPIHLIGHSRGGSLVARMAQFLGSAGIWVDELTTLDPHPIEDDFHSPNDPSGSYTIPVYDNVVFADNFYRDEENTVTNPGGTYVQGARNFHLNGVLTGTSANEHSEVHGYYHGTIDRDAVNDGHGVTIFSSWYSDNYNRATTGFNFSRTGRGAQSVLGIGEMFGGQGSRWQNQIVSSTWYSNVGMLSVTDGNDGVFTSGEAITVDYRYQAIHASQPTTVQFYLDNNTNPFDGATVIGSQIVAPTGYSAPSSQFMFNWPGTSQTPPLGTYRIGAKITNPDGLSRFTYHEPPILIGGAGAKIITKEWIGDVSTSWTDERNWTPGGMPSNSDRALINAGVPSLSSGSADGEVEVISGLNWSGGTVLGTVNNTGTLTISGFNGIKLAGTLTNSGTLVHAGTGLVSFQSGTIQNTASGTIDFRSTGRLVDNIGTNLIANAGLIRRTVSTATQEVEVPLNNDGGTVQIMTGTLSFTGGGVSTSAAYSASAAATFAFDPDPLRNFSFVGPNSAGGAGTIRISGGGSVGGGTGTLTLTGNSTWSDGGTIVGTNVSNTGTLTISGFNGIKLAGTLTNSGTLVHAGTGLVSFQSGTIQNTASGTIDFRSTGRLVDNIGTNLIANAGLIRRTVSTATQEVEVPLNNNGGTVELLTGTFLLNANYVQSSTGTLAVRIASS